MGTRGVIGFVDGRGWKGRYHHCDSYPTALGQTLWDVYHDVYHGDLAHMLRNLYIDHPAGWSTINEREWSFDVDGNLKAEFVEHGPDWWGVPSEYRAWYQSHRKPECYCHGDRQQGEWMLSHDGESDVNATSCEWGYIFAPPTAIMHIIGSRYDADSHVSRWRHIATIDMQGAEPNWELIDSLRYSELLDDPDYELDEAIVAQMKALHGDVYTNAPADSDRRATGGEGEGAHE
jgi:hypothetical protein